MAKMQSPVKLQTLVIIGAIVVGAAVAASLFILYPGMMLDNTSLDPESSGGAPSGAYGPDTGGTPGTSPQAPVP